MVLYRYRTKYAFQMKYCKKKNEKKLGLMSLQYHGFIKKYRLIYQAQRYLIFTFETQLWLKLFVEFHFYAHTHTDRHFVERAADAVRVAGPHELPARRLSVALTARAARRRHVHQGVHAHLAREQAALPVERLQRAHHEHHGLRGHVLSARVHVPGDTAAAALNWRDRAVAASSHALSHPTSRCPTTFGSSTWTRRPSWRRTANSIRYRTCPSRSCPRCAIIWARRWPASARVRSRTRSSRASSSSNSSSRRRRARSTTSDAPTTSTSSASRSIHSYTATTSTPWTSPSASPVSHLQELLGQLQRAHAHSAPLSASYLYFHTLAADQVELHSAGSDFIIWQSVHL